MQATVLIVDGIVTNRIMLKVQLSAAYYHVVQTDRMDGIAGLAQRVQPDLIVTAMALPDGNATGLRSALLGDPALAAIPVLAIAAQNDRAARMAALEAGLDDVLNHPVDDQMLQARIRSLLRMRASTDEFGLPPNGSPPQAFHEAAAGFAPPARVALLAGTPALAQGWRGALEGIGRHVYLTPGGTEAAALMAEPVADAFVIRIGGGAQRRGLQLIADLRARTATCRAVIVAVTDPGDGAAAADALDRGASDVLAEGFCAEELALRLTTQLRRKRLTDQLRATVRAGLRAAVRDPMTGLFNRRHALPALARSVQLAGESGRPFAVMLADLDHFKRINDRFGHLAGDAVLVETARRLQQALGPQDMLARVGGEEFMAVLPDTGPAEASAAAGRMVRAINSRPYALGGGAAMPVTISVGVAIGQPDPAALPSAVAELLVGQADQALYAAKGGGRNMVSLVRPAA